MINSFLQVLNEAFSARLKELMSPQGTTADDAAIISVDKMGIDVRIRFGHDYFMERVGFNEVLVNFVYCKPFCRFVLGSSNNGPKCRMSTL